MITLYVKLAAVLAGGFLLCGCALTAGVQAGLPAALGGVSGLANSLPAPLELISPLIMKDAMAVRQLQAGLDAIASTPVVVMVPTPVVMNPPVVVGGPMVPANPLPGSISAPVVAPTTISVPPLPGENPALSHLRIQR